MTSDVRVELAAKAHRDDLENFPCCIDHHVFGSPRRRCMEAWSHQVQTYVRTRALRRTSSADGRAADHRLLLVYDGDLLQAVVAHQRVHPLPDDLGTSREIDFIAVRTSMRGEQLSDGSRCSDSALAVVLEDAARREPELTHVRAEVHRRNEPSLGLVRRHGGLIAEAAGDVHIVLVPVGLDAEGDPHGV